MKTLSQSMRLLSLAFLPFQGRVRTLYSALADGNSLCHDARYLNLGYWKHGAKTLDEAAAALAELLAGAVGLSPDDDVLDAGFGFGDQDFYWHEKHSPRKIVGVNVTPVQVRAARDRAARLGLSDRVAFYEADATRIPFPAESFSVVFALESAFHFRTREDFLREAFRVLRPGGRLALADLCAVARTLALKDRLAERIGRSFWQIPKENLYPADVYRARIEAAGFVNTRLDSIWHDVYPPFVDFARARLDDSELQRRMNPVFRRMLTASLKARKRLSPEAMDYVLAVAEKPRRRGHEGSSRATRAPHAASSPP